jgi:hypothetical protein
VNLEEAIDTWPGFEDAQERFDADTVRLCEFLRGTRDQHALPYVIGVTTQGDPVYRFGRDLTARGKRALIQNGVRWKKWYLTPGQSMPSEKDVEHGWSECGDWEPLWSTAATMEEERLGKRDYIARVCGQTRFG